MSGQNKKVIIVCGPTGSGKSDYALKLAMELNGELINADSRQIYKYLDIGTNKDIPTDYERFFDINLNDTKDVFSKLKANPYRIDSIPIHLISFLNPDINFDLFRYKELATLFIADILNRGKLPILVGGTGLYIDSLVKNYSLEEVEADKKLRDELNKLELNELQNILIEEDKDTFAQLNDSDRNNPRRLMRLIEKVRNLKNDTEIIKDERLENIDFEMHYMNIDLGKLTEKLNKRVDEMILDGLVDEVLHVIKLGFPKDSVALQGIGYREVLDYIDKKVEIEEMIDRIKISHRQYAKRQKTWFEGDGRNYVLKIV